MRVSRCGVKKRWQWEHHRPNPLFWEHRSEGSGTQMTVAYSYLQNGRLRCQGGFFKFFQVAGRNRERRDCWQVSRFTYFTATVPLQFNLTGGLQIFRQAEWSAQKPQFLSEFWLGILVYIQEDISILEFPVLEKMNYFFTLSAQVKQLNEISYVYFSFIQTRVMQPNEQTWTSMIKVRKAD